MGVQGVERAAVCLVPGGLDKEIERRESLMGRKIAGIIGIVLGLVAGIGGIYRVAGNHTKSGIVLLIAFVILLIIGILLIALPGRKSASTAVK